ncbi:dihydrofolate reductase family protein [Streptosporangium sp. NBC_01810]|uniref:dihydrofolate reductase family protein n=1 Tax=Streptosporangium sp. NBC_01810 TaxID=2975951 RepID=UPI002DDBB96B|nr:dihydrofolate reductase family protein [Streptosporangium sp. NBC_01810]WSA24354.1 dihydrofolate reductase family protein [Streptosporangium sp. NBC_01810]
MRKIFSFIMTTLDGYFEGRNHDLGWHNVDEEFGEFAARQLDESGTLVFGRVTYRLMAGFWPTPEGEKADPAVAARMNGTDKIVVSRTQDRVEWAGTRLIKQDLVEEFTRLKREPGKDIAILGSSDLTVSLLRLGLVDELRIMVNPVVLGEGTPLFGTVMGRIDLKLLKTRTFNSGNVLHHYRPAV